MGKFGLKGMLNTTGLYNAKDYGANLYVNLAPNWTSEDENHVVAMPVAFDLGRYPENFSARSEAPITSVGKWKPAGWGLAGGAEINYTWLYGRNKVALLEKRSPELNALLKDDIDTENQLFEFVKTIPLEYWVLTSEKIDAAEGTVEDKLSRYNISLQRYGNKLDRFFKLEGEKTAARYISDNKLNKLGKAITIEEVKKQADLLRIFALNKLSDLTGKSMDIKYIDEACEIQLRKNAKEKMGELNYLKVGGGLIDQRRDSDFSGDFLGKYDPYVTQARFFTAGKVFGAYGEVSHLISPHYKIGASLSFGTAASFSMKCDGSDTEVVGPFEGAILSVGLRNTIYPLKYEKEDRAKWEALGVIPPNDDLAIHIDGAFSHDFKDTREDAETNLNDMSWQAAASVDWKAYENDSGDFSLRLLPGLTGGATRAFSGDWGWGILGGLSVSMNWKGTKAGDLSLTPYLCYGYGSNIGFSDGHGVVTDSAGYAGYTDLFQYNTTGATGAGDVSYDEKIHTVGAGLKLGLKNFAGVDGLVLSAMIGVGSQGTFNNGEGTFQTLPAFSVGVEYAFDV